MTINIMKWQKAKQNEMKWNDNKCYEMTKMQWNDKKWNECNEMTKNEMKWQKDLMKWQKI
jgi:hypothetical protein